MLIIVNTHVRVEEVDNLREFAVLSALELADVGAQLEASKLGRADTTHAWIDVEALRERAEPLSREPAWEAEYDQMLAYARSKGWWDEASNAIRAHISAPS